MGDLLHFAPRTVTGESVRLAQATYFAMILAEVDEPRLLDDLAHQQAKDEAREKYLRLYEEWSRR